MKCDIISKIYHPFRKERISVQKNLFGLFDKRDFLHGADDGARTRYLHLGKVALYQMSYIRKLVPPAGIEPATRGFSVRCSTN